MLIAQARGFVGLERAFHSMYRDDSNLRPSYFRCFVCPNRFYHVRSDEVGLSFFVEEDAGCSFLTAYGLYQDDRRRCNEGWEHHTSKGVRTRLFGDGHLLPADCPKCNLRLFPFGPLEAVGDVGVFLYRRSDYLRFGKCLLFHFDGFHFDGPR